MEEENLNSRLMALVALCARYCSLVENAPMKERDEFVKELVDCLPRIYWEFANIDAVSLDAGGYLNMPDYMDEDYYDSVRRGMETLFGEDDMFLDTFEEDMKYSDTPVAVSISEGLADLFQEFYNFINTVRDTTDETVSLALQGVSEDFKGFWSQTLCNTLRALNHIYTRSES